MKKFIIFIILAVIGCGLFALAAINDSLDCSHYSNTCSLKSKISFINYTVSDTQFASDALKNGYCDVDYQPNAGGKKPYYLLKITLNDNTEYTLGSYQKQGLCQIYADKITDFIKKKTHTVEYKPTFGFLNLMGYIFGFLMFFIGVIVLRAKPEYDNDYGFEDEEDDEASPEDTKPE